MDRRLQLQTLLETIIGPRSDGQKNVYFQPPAGVKIVYPCIIYSRNAGDTKFANDKPYNQTVGYQVIVIDANPDSLIPGKVASLPLCKFNRHYTKDNLNHDVYNLYY